MSNIRMNVVIEKNRYEIFQKLVHEKGESIASFINRVIDDHIRVWEYERDKKAFDELAGEKCTKEMLEIEKECCNDGIK